MTVKQPAKSKGPIIAAVAGGVVVVALILAVALGGSTQPGAEFGDPTVSDEALPIMPPNQVVDSSATGVTIPEAVGQDFDGSEVRIENDGRAKAIVFLAHWCSHCQAEVPRVQAWLDETGGVEGVDIYSVATSMNSGRPNYPPSDWLESEGWTPPVLRDNQDNLVHSYYGAGGFPFWVFVEEDGTVALRTSGETSVADLETIMEALVTN